MQFSTLSKKKVVLSLQDELYVIYDVFKKKLPFFAKTRLPLFFLFFSIKACANEVKT